MKKTVAAGLGVCAVALAFAAKDPVIMTVNGTDVPQSEFEYLYNKNSQQQINPQSLEEYVEMFKLYKMKVADARAEGLDTLPSFVKEAEQYRHDLSAPYLTDSLYINQLVQEAYDRSREEVEAYHIMIFKQRDENRNPEMRQRADSIREVLLAGGDFAELAAKYSQDRGSRDKGGRMGYITAGTYPVAFEIAAYNLPEGQISEVVESPVGYHILKGGKHRNARGKVQAQHILKLTQNLDEAGQARAKREIDSLYQVVKADPSKFSDLAKTHSDDRGSARQGGMLPVFGTGEMVEQFDSAAFALKPGEISEPVRTAYGWHIIRKVSSQPIATLEQMKPQTVARMTSPQDPRFKMIRDRQTEKFAAIHKASLNNATAQEILDDAALGMDSTFHASWVNAPKGDKVIAVVDGRNVPVRDFAKTLYMLYLPGTPATRAKVQDELDAFYNNLVVSAEEERLAKDVPEYANLLKEYVDGSLLYEVSVRKVWDRAAKDTEGLEKYFDAHRDNYKWTEPHAKGFLVQAANDSVAELVKARVAGLPSDSIVPVVRKEFKNKATADRVLVSQGTNPMIDNLLFGGPEAKPSNANYTVYFMIEPRLILEPEEVADVRGLVTSDYQNEFQTAWENELRRKYPVKVNQKVLKKVKPIEK